MKPRVLVVIPAYNEQDTIEQVVRASQQFADVCVVDDASRDRTPQILAAIPGVRTIRHQANTHIPGAIRDGMRLAAEQGYDFCITMDAGMSHDPQAIPQFLAHADADLVIGYRETRVNVPWYRRLLSWVGTRLINFALSPRLALWGGRRDLTSGYRMYSRRAFESLIDTPMVSRSFDFHLEAAALIYRRGMRISEVPITYVFSNSSLRWKVVAQAMRTWWYLCRRRGATADSGMAARSHSMKSSGTA